MEEIHISSTSRSSAEAEEIVLRLTERVRLVFIPTIVDNQKEPDACVKGVFVYQKKKQKNEWENIKEISLSQLRPAEGVQLELKSAELHHLLKNLADLYRIHRKEGVPKGRSTYVKVTDQISELGRVSEEEFQQYLEINKTTGIEIFRRLAQWLSQIDDRELVLSSLESLELDNLKQLNIIVGLGSLKHSLRTWETFRDNSDEEFWQNELLNNSFILSQIFSYPIVVIKGKAYVGGKSVSNTGGNIVDYLCKNELTDNAVLVEIKTPMTPLVGKQYRAGVYNISEEMSGSVIQVSNYANSLSKHYNGLVSDTPTRFQTFKPHCVVIAGNCQKELDEVDKRKSFELYRNGLKDVEVVTYDELFGKVENFIYLLEHGC